MTVIPKHFMAHLTLKHDLVDDQLLQAVFPVSAKKCE